MAAPRKEEISDVRFLGNILQQVENQFRDTDYTDPLKQALSLLEESHKGFFASQSDPNGNAWAALKPSTIAKKGHSTILIDTSALHASLSGQGSGAIRESNDEGLIFGTSIPYAFYHQEGTSRLPQRAMVGYSADALDKTVELVADHAVDALKG